MAIFKQNVISIAQICARKGVTDFIISPGSRSAPLTLALVRHSKISCRMIVDERSAGFIALGMAQQLGRPVGLVCTSGTAALNFAPAVAEAFNQNVSLLVFTADRPAEWIDQQDNQTIRQREIYGRNCLASFDFPADDSHPDARWHAERLISEAINLSQNPVPGPVHVNVPLREPLYPTSEFGFGQKQKIISVAATTTDLADWSELDTEWHRHKKKLIVAGMYNPDAYLSELLAELGQKQDIPILYDITSNLATDKLTYFDTFLWSNNERFLQQLAPDLLITFGGPLVSKTLKLFLRTFEPKAHWQIQSHYRSIDTFQALTRIVPVAPATVFDHFSIADESNHAYHETWLQADKKTQNLIESYLREVSFCEFSAMERILHHLPVESRLQLGNSSIVRWASFMALPASSRVKVNSNRGTSGIDGTVSTAVGAALTTDEITTLIVGDLGFFYDRNALWNSYVPGNLRIIVFNNDGGGIFRILDGSSTLPEMAEHFEVPHGLTAELTARQHGLDYFFCNSKDTLEKILTKFYDSRNRPALLEVKFDKLSNADAFFKYKKIAREIQ